jgi:hypothetical protein
MVEMFGHGSEVHFFFAVLIVIDSLLDSLNPHNFETTTYLQAIERLSSSSDRVMHLTHGPTLSPSSSNMYLQKNYNTTLIIPISACYNSKLRNAI